MRAHRIVIDTVLQPDPDDWSPSTHHGPSDPLDRERRLTRTELGVDPDALLIATGHQAAIWHPGILAKDLAIVELASTLHDDGRMTQAVHFIADHDANDGGLIPYPTADLQRRAWRMLPAKAGVSTCDLPPATPSAPPRENLGLHSIDRGMQAIQAAVHAHRDAPNLAFQIGLATADLARPFTGDIPRRSMSGLLGTPIGAFLLDAMNSDPDACIEAHDQALESDRRLRARDLGRLPRPVARPLRRGDGAELPLWRRTDSGRRPVRRGEPIDPDSCRPRALLATALARLGGCDLFVHGTGGAIYDRAMEIWIRNWLGEPIAATLAPSTTATATLRLPLEPPDVKNAIDQWTPEGLHRLRSDPDLARSGTPRRSILLEAIDAAPRGSRTRRDAYLALRAEVEEARRRGEAEILRYRNELARKADDRRRIAVARDRTWAFPFHPEESLDALRASMRSAFAGAGEPQASPNTRGR